MLTKFSQLSRTNAIIITTHTPNSHLVHDGTPGVVYQSEGQI